ncbi:hypothetical protein I3843_14G107500 [Carya illinoinensis]|uniref:Late embryogenesis abundant protein LEA-2 subgroup domain-containing protein n=1 Tax=Carya illinoinensis TaxID=32201 RepID=A0A8T1NIX4_CARIL|nr:uncharacterized protein At1g08160 [Carya illinoinensis]KAG2670920.1 hypothetical protein I3760_14G108800 [Carya illinoinensis]KAG6629748.1 hypothetical protein CIPAW_14G106700 [Carya illinoinensis]KAG6679018.1 hypothetical protein I3842_14G109700 [Carya illinoinensis]KAG7947714.1 hypothetical protein I3843_14G107500 [Carya illinoinensis]
MATPAQQQAARRPAHSKVLRSIAIVLLALIVLVGVAVLITWLVIRPKQIVYTVEDGSVHNFNLGTHGQLNATFNFAIRSYNPNSRVSIYYDSIQVSAEYDDQTLALNMVDPYFQPHRNVTRLEVNLTAQNVSLSGSTTRDLKIEKSSGAVEIDVLLKAKIRYKVGRWKSAHHTLRIWCSPVLVHFSRFKSFERTYCDVEL